MGLKYTASPDWSKIFFKPVNIDFAFKALQKSAIFGYGGFEFKAVSDKWLHKTEERRKNARKQGNQLRLDNHSRKDALASAKAAHTVHCFWRKCSVVFDPE